VNNETRVGAFIIVAIGIFFYLSFNIGSLRFDSSSFAYYKTYFEDTQGLDTKSPVKIAGVKVGWVDSIKLLDAGRAEISLRIKQTHKLSRNAYATISQDGMIGSKTIEIDPGDPSTGTLPPGSTLAMPGKTSANLPDIMERIKDISDSVQDVVSVFKGVFASPRGESLLQSSLDNLSVASEKLSNFSHKIDNTITKNEEKIDSFISNIDASSQELSSGIPKVKDSIVSAGNEMATTSKKFGQTADFATETFKQTEQVASKINEGSGTLGKLINDSQLHKDIHDTVKGVKGFVGKAHNLEIDLNMLSERTFRTGNSRGSLDLSFRTYQDYFYNLQICSDEYGQFDRTITHHNYYNADGTQIDSNSTTGLNDYQKGQIFVSRAEEVKQNLTKPTFGFQFGKTFDRLTLRVGMFENNFGFAADLRMPIKNDKVRWETSFEAFDFAGYSRIDDDRPRMRWRNKISFMDHLYTTFGLEDIVSRGRASPFYGGGLTFNDDDIKYLISMLPLGGLKG
jgi:phospholipid/cholesterol/gamma-HCH transport system substrate-binding protein